MRYDNQKLHIMTEGLSPLFCFLVLSIVINTYISMYLCTLVGIVYFFLKLKSKSLYSPSIVLLNTLMSMTLFCLLYPIGGDSLIPENSITVSITTIILFLSLIYTISPHLYDKFNKLYYYKNVVLNHWSSLLTCITFSLYLIIFTVIQISSSSISTYRESLLIYILPILLIIICFLLDSMITKRVKKILRDIPIIRTIIICNGKIYVSPRRRHKINPKKLDTPIEDYITRLEENHDEMVKDMIIKSGKVNIKREQLDPRFNLKYISEENGEKHLVLLYVLPIKDESIIEKGNGKFVIPQDIEKEKEKYSSFINNELPHIMVATSLWNEFS